MNKNLEDIQIMLKSIARRALALEELIDNERAKNRWNASDHYTMEDALRQIKFEHQICDALQDKVELDLRGQNFGGLE